MQLGDDITVRTHFYRHQFMVTLIIIHLFFIVSILSTLVINHPRYCILSKELDQNYRGLRSLLLIDEHQREYDLVCL